MASTEHLTQAGYFAAREKVSYILASSKYDITAWDRSLAEKLLNAGIVDLDALDKD